MPAEFYAEVSHSTTGSGRVDGIDATRNRLVAEYVAEHGREPSAAAVARLRQQATLETRSEKGLHSLADLTKKWRTRATALLGEEATTWAQHLLSLGASEAPLRADDVAVDRVVDIAAVVLMEVVSRRSVWNRWNIRAESMRQLMGVRFVSAADGAAPTAVSGRTSAVTTVRTVGRDRNSNRRSSTVQCAESAHPGRSRVRGRTGWFGGAVNWTIDALGAVDMAGPPSTM